MEYKISKGLFKGVISALTVLGSLVAFASFSDVALWTLLEQYLKPVLGSMTVGGLITFSINFLKVKIAK